ncbi:MAG: GntR family transcriptional regulator, partial [Burkholderiales bacterium]|nr:GntR family transcriptional regulator [Burkholderiales bacterium]
GISRITVRQALARLVRNAQVVTRRGKGSFVARPALQQHLGRLQGFHDALLAQGADPRTELLEWSASAGGSDLALPAGLDLPVRLLRRYDLDERPFSVVEAYLPAAAAPLGAERARRLTVYEILREFLGVEIERADVAIRCCRPSAAVRRELGLAAAQPVLLMERSSFDAAGRTCEFMRISILPERYTFRMSLAGPIEIARGLERARAAPAARNPVPRTHKA